MAPAPFGTTPPTTHHPTPGVTTIAHYSGASQTGSPFKDKLVAALDIPLELTDHTDKNLGFAWQKYKACEAAIKTCDSLWQSGKLKEVFDKKPSQSDIVSIFKGKSQYHLTYKKAFPKVSQYTEMVSWLEDASDKLSDLELWGVFKPSYTFSDLLEWLASGGKGLDMEVDSDEGESDEGESARKEEQMAKDKDKNKQGKGKGKEKGKEKGKKK